MRLTPHGGAGTVTGSKQLIEYEGARVLVDCGMFQGVKLLRERNWQPFPFDPGALAGVLLTHAHIDHTGMLPALVREGYRGPIYATHATCALAHILLRDSARLQEEDAHYANRKGFSKHRPARPLYTEQDAERALAQMHGIELGDEIEVGPLRARFANAGHILGAAHITVCSQKHTVVFSGDVGRPGDELMMPPAPPTNGADLVVLESTYGDRVHPPAPEASLAAVIDSTLERGGVLLIPAFAVGRTQGLLLHIDRILDARSGPRPPVFVNSPMATSVTRLYARHADLLRIGADACGEVLRDATFVQTVEDSKELNRRGGPMIVISASGMLTGGRVLHHLKAYGPEARNTILLAGFQAPGTRGGRLVAGERELKIHGAVVPMRAEVAQMGGLSAHADQNELIAWLKRSGSPPRQVLINHGEPAAADALRARLAQELEIEARVAEPGAVVDVGSVRS